MKAAKRRLFAIRSSPITLRFGWTALFLSICILLSCGAAEAFFGFKDKKAMELVFHEKLDGKLKSAPFFSAEPGSKKHSNMLVYATTRYDPEQKGGATTVEIVDFDGRPSENSPVTGIEVFAGYHVAGVDLDGDGGREIALLDADGRLRLLDESGVPLSSGLTESPEIRVLLYPPLASDLDGDGKNELLLIAEELEGEKTVVRLIVCDGSGKVMNTVDLTGKPETPPAIARLAGDTHATVAFVREDGMIRLIGIFGGAAVDAGRIELGRVRDADLCSFSENGGLGGGFAFVDGSDKLTLIIRDDRKNISLQEHLTGVDNASFVKVAAGGKPDGKALFCLYDETGRQFVFFSTDGASPTVLPAGEPDGKLPIRLSVAPIDGENRPYFVAMLFKPGGSRLNDGIHAVFESHATESMKQEAIRYEKARYKRYEALKKIPDEVVRHLEDAVREYKLALLIDHMGQDEAEALAFGRMQTDVLFFDASGKLFDGFPLSFPDLHPFADRKGVKSFPIDLHRDSTTGQTYCLIGLNGEGAGPGEIFLYRSR